MSILLELPLPRAYENTDHFSFQGLVCFLRGNPDLAVSGLDEYQNLQIKREREIRIGDDV